MRQSQRMNSLVTPSAKFLCVYFFHWSTAKSHAIHCSYSNLPICTQQDRKIMERGKQIPNFKLSRQLSPIFHTMSKFSGTNMKWEMWIFFSVGLASNGPLIAWTFCCTKYNPSALKYVLLCKIFLKHKLTTALYLLLNWKTMPCFKAGGNAGCVGIIEKCSLSLWSNNFLRNFPMQF